MLYVFHVNTGSMMILDMSLTTESVQNLKEYIERAYKIDAEKQVLLISGGECLESTRRVCSYSSGTDTNPIYLCTKLNDAVFKPVLDFREELELLGKVTQYAELPPSFQAVDKRAELAQELSNNTGHLFRLCERLVSDQHNQQQGWAAVVANFEDVMIEFKNQFDQLEYDFMEYRKEKEYYTQFLFKFKEDIQILRRIPVLPKLFQSNNQKQYLMDTSEEMTKNNAAEIRENMVSLFDWIGKDEHGNDLEIMFEKCVIELEYYEQEEFNRLSLDVSAVLRSAETEVLREVSGMGQRLFLLDYLMRGHKDSVLRQNELATAFTKNQTQVQNLKDSSVLPDLCSSHQSQLKEMSTAQGLIMEACAKFNRAKGEVNEALFARINWAMHIQNQMQKIGDQIAVFSENIGKLRYQMGILEQVDLAPVAYLSYIAEIVRRRSFSQACIMWASELACRLLTIHNEEVAKRKEFQSKYENHFIQALFPGMDDLPPGYGIQAPSYFDTGLPKLTREDVDFIKTELPDMTEYLNTHLPSESSYCHLFKSVLNTEEEKFPEENMFQEVVDQIEISNNIETNASIINEGNKESSLISVHGLSHLKDIDRGCESETDTEEFEKVGQSPLDMNFDKEIPSPRPCTKDASTLTEGNLEISKCEHQKLKFLLTRIVDIVFQTIKEIKSEVANIKHQYSADKNALLQSLGNLNTACTSLGTEQVLREESLIQRISNDHSNEINDFRKLAQVKNEEIKNLRTMILFLESRMENLNSELNQSKDVLNRERVELEKKIFLLESEKEKCVREVTEKLNREHKDEIKTLQARFKLVTMERSPSESSLEKTLEFSSFNNHEFIISQMKEHFELDKEKAVNEIVEIETRKWKGVIEQLKTDFEIEKNILLGTLATKLTEEKEGEIKLLREREQLLMNRIEVLEMETTNNKLHMDDNIDSLEDRNLGLRLEFQKFGSDGADMSSSVGSFSGGKTDSATSPIKQRRSLTKSLSVSSGKINKLSMDSLKHGDCVVIVWDEEHESFKVVQDNPVIYFLHPDSLESLHLEISEGPPKKPNKLYCLAEYVDREYCHARKSGNRYKVPKGTRFFRVKVRPLERERIPEASSKFDITMTQSQISDISSASTTETEFHSLPSSPKLKSTVILPETEISSEVHVSTECE